MNKMKLALFVGFVLCFGVSSTAFATSGACSGHGGVDCSAGADYDGSVVCYDGWRNSSVSYSSMVMCSSYTSPTYNAPSYNTTQSCPSFSYKDLLYGGCKCMTGYVVGKDIFGKQSCVSADSACRDQLGIMSRYNSLKDVCECSSGYIINNGKCTSHEDYCSDSFGYGARYNLLKDQCECKSGYTFNGSRCSLDLNTYNYSAPTYYPAPAPVQSCPQNSTLKNDGLCYCNSGYQISLDKASCMAISCGSNSTLVGSSCQCNEGFIESAGSCISHSDNCRNSFGPNSYGVKGSDGNSSCYCNDGYDWSLDRKSCVLKPVLLQDQSAPQLNSDTGGVDMISFCIATLGANAQFNSGTGNCECPSGFAIKDGVCARAAFSGIPKNKMELGKCLIVGSKTLKKYYLKGSPTIMKLNIKNVQCYVAEAEVKVLKYVKSK